MATESSESSRLRSTRQRVRAVLFPRTERDRERRRILAMLVPFFSLAVVAAFVPLITMTLTTVSESRFEIAGFTLEAWRALATDPLYHEVAWNTLWFAAVTTVSSVFVAVVVAHSLQKYDLPGERLVVAIVSFPISLPGIVVAFMIIVLLGRQGLLTNAAAFFTGGDPISMATATSIFGLYLGYLFSLIPRSTMVMRATYGEINRTAEEAARALGAGPLETFYHVTLPEIRPGIVAAIILTFRTALAIFGTVLVLKSLVVVTLRIDMELGSAGGFNIQLASAIGVIFFLFSLAFTFVGLKYTSAEVVEI
jgi:putative spermidine/putrescine transport system permease protein